MKQLATVKGIRAKSGQAGGKCCIDCAARGLEVTSLHLPLLSCHITFFRTISWTQPQLVSSLGFRWDSAKSELTDTADRSIDARWQSNVNNNNNNGGGGGGICIISSCRISCRQLGAGVWEQRKDLESRDWWRYDSTHRIHAADGWQPGHNYEAPVTSSALTGVKRCVTCSSSEFDVVRYHLPVLSQITFGGFGKIREVFGKDRSRSYFSFSFFSFFFLLVDMLTLFEVFLYRVWEGFRQFLWSGQ